MSQSNYDEHGQTDYCKKKHKQIMDIAFYGDAGIYYNDKYDQIPYIHNIYELNFKLHTINTHDERSSIPITSLQPITKYA